MKILVTGGATREPIDQVRFITNFSTGTTSAELADFFAECGDEVTLLAGEGANVAKNRQVKLFRFGSFHDLDTKLRETLSAGDYDVVLHLAAVSDFSVRAVETGGSTFDPGTLPKIDSNEEEILVRLGRNFKILERLKTYSRGRAVIVGFKLTNTTSPETRQSAVARIAGLEGVDFVVHNDFSELKSGDKRRFAIFRDTALLRSVNGVPGLAKELREVLK